MQYSNLAIRLISLTILAARATPDYRQTLVKNMVKAVNIFNELGNTSIKAQCLQLMEYIHVHAEKCNSQ